MIFQAGVENRSRPDRRLNNKGSFKQDETEDHHENEPWSEVLKRPHPTGVGKDSFNEARNSLSSEHLIGEGDKIAKKVEEIKVSNLPRHHNVWRNGGAQERH